MDKKKVLLVNPSLCQGGREHSLITMLRLLDKTKYDLTLFTYRDDMTLLPLVPKEIRVVTDENKPHYYRKPKAVFYNLLKTVTKKLKMKSFSEKMSEKLRVYIHQQKIEHPARDIFNNEHFDVVVANAEGFTAELSAYVSSKKRYIFYHNSIDMHHDSFEKILLQYDAVIGVSQGVKKMLCDNYLGIQDKIIVIENYVDAQNILDKSNSLFENEIKEKLVLCTCGRASKEKGFDLAVESARLLKEQGVDFIWYFVSDGVERERIEKLIDKYLLNKQIVITGYVDNPFPYYKFCDVYIQPSYHESFGLTMKEAIILGKPVVSTDTVGGCTVLENGKYGEIVDFSPQSIVNGIMVAINKEQQGLYHKYDIRINEHEKNEYITKLENVLDS